MYWLGPMCGGIAASLLYDFLFYPRSDNFSNRWNVLSSGEEVETAAPDVSVDGSSSPVPSQWPRHWGSVFGLVIWSAVDVLLIAGMEYECALTVYLCRACFFIELFCQALHACDILGPSFGSHCYEELKKIVWIKSVFFIYSLCNLQ